MNKNEVDMTSGNLFIKLLKVSAPLILSGILQLFYNAADLIVCGSFGSGHAVAAISGTNSLVGLIVNLFLGLSVGANVLMARCYGEKNQEKGQRVVYSAIIFSLFFGVFVGLFGFFMSHYFLVWMGTPDDVINLSALYLKIYFLGLPFSMIYNFGSSLLRALGDTKRPFYFLAISGVVNVLLNLFFVIVLNLDVAGVALATVISQLVSATLIMICLLRNKGFFHFKIKEVRFYYKEALEIMRIGFPAGIQGVIFAISNVLIQSSINSLGTLVMDGNGASSSLEGFIYISMNSVAQASVAFISANCGANKMYNVKKIIRNAFIIILLMNLLVGGIIYLFQEPLLSLYISDEASFTAAKARFIIIVTTYFTCGFMDTLAYSIRGIGYSLAPTIISLVGVCGTRITWLFTFFHQGIFHSISGIIISYPISWVLTSLVHLVVLIILMKKVKANGK